MPRAGDRTRNVTRTTGGRRREAVEETIAVEPARLIESLVEQQEFDTRSRFELESVDGWTRLTVTCDYTWHAVRFQLLSPLVEWSASRRIERMLVKLKQVVETGESSS